MGPDDLTAAGLLPPMGGGGLGGYSMGDLMRAQQRQKFSNMMLGIGSGLLSAGMGGPYGAQQRGLQQAAQAVNQGAVDPMDYMRAQYMQAQMGVQQAKAAATQAEAAAQQRVQARLAGGETMESIRSSPEGRADLMAAGEVDYLTEKTSAADLVKVPDPVNGGFRYVPAADAVGQQGYEKPPDILNPDVFNARLRLARESATRVNVDNRGNELPPPPASYSYAYNDDGTVKMEDFTRADGSVVKRPVTVPIGSAAAEADALKAAEAAGQEMDQKYGGVALDEIGIAREALGAEGLPATGLIGWLASGAPGSNAFKLAGALQGIESQITFERLNTLRQSSATGASGLGQVTKPELDLLASSMGALRQADDEDVFRRRLDRVERDFEDVVYGKSGRFASMPDDQFYAVNVDRLSPSGRQKYISETDKRRLRMQRDVTESPGTGVGDVMGKPAADMGDDELRDAMRREFGG